MKKPKLPQTDSIEELAQFWDTHDFTDFEDELEEVSEPVFQRETVVQLQLPSEYAEAVERLASSQGIKPSHLTREWVHEKVQATNGT